MNSDLSPLPAWMAPVRDALESQGRSGVFLVAFETYRPDLVRALAHALDFRFIDFRAEHMQPLGADAARLPVAKMEEVIDRTIHADPAPAGVVLHNAEALLATRPADARAAWMLRMLDEPTRVPVLLPLALFTDAAPATSARLVRVDTRGLPPEKLLFRLGAR